MSDSNAPEARPYHHGDLRRALVDAARRLLDERPELKNRHFAILVSNEDGDEICRIPLDVIH